MIKEGGIIYKCPHCGSQRLIRNGTSTGGKDGKFRYEQFKCKKCLRYTTRPKGRKVSVKR